jgi:leucyl aminopeptidase
VATLTGACVIALGSVHSGLYANDDALAADLLRAGEDAGDSAWRMPLDAAYQKQIDSPVADMVNSAGRDAGSVTAACFLSRFTDVPWAHLDIAGTAWKGGREKSGTGRPVALLTQYLIMQAQAQADRAALPPARAA